MENLSGLPEKQRDFGEDGGYALCDVNHKRGQLWKLGAAGGLLILGAIGPSLAER